jgi:hypothetical protein
MSEIFSIFEDSLKIVLKNINKSLNKSSLNDDDMEKLHFNMKEAQRIIRQMELEINSKNNEVPKDLKTRYNNYKNQIDEYNVKYSKIQELYIQNKNQNSLAFDFTDIDSSKKIQKESLIDNEGGLYGMHNTLDEIQREAYRIEDMGNNMRYQFEIQGDQMKNIRDNIFDLNSHINHSNKLINNMLKRENRNKCILFLLIVIGCVILLIIFYYKFFK